MQLADELERLDGIETLPGAGEKTANFYREQAVHARTFVMRMYDPVQGLFYTGVKSDGKTVNRDVYPLDVNTWGLLAFYDDPAIDVRKIFATIESRFGVDGMYDFNDDRDGIWWEGSLQKILAEKVAGNAATYSAQLAIAGAAAEPDGSITAANRNGVSTGIWLEGANPDGTPKGNEWKYSKRIHTGATAWLALAQLGVNPLDPYRSRSNIIRPVSGQVNAYVRDGRLYVAGLAPQKEIAVYSVDGGKIAGCESATEMETFVCNLPARGVYVVASGTESRKVMY
jgi:hypothetical protein